MSFNQNIHVPSARAGLPLSSWWADAKSRDAFNAAQRDAQARMEQSALGKHRKLTTSKDTEQVERLD